MIEKLMAMDPAVIVAWLQLAVLVVGIVAHLVAKWRELEAAGKLDRWAFIKDAVPEIHGVVQKIAAATRTQKDDAFVAQIDKLLRAAGLLPVQPHEVEAIKALGSGYHQETKALIVPTEPVADPRPGPA